MTSHRDKLLRWSQVGGHIVGVGCCSQEERDFPVAHNSSQFRTNVQITTRKNNRPQIKLTKSSPLSFKQSSEINVYITAPENKTSDFFLYVYILFLSIISSVLQPSIMSCESFRKSFCSRVLSKTIIANSSQSCPQYQQSDAVEKIDVQTPTTSSRDFR